MKKLALLIGNNRGQVGSDIDIKSYKRFLTSPYGGYWNEQEILDATHYNREYLLRLLCACREKRLDYFLLIFSGHGGINRKNNETTIELATKEDIRESEIINIAKRQLTILDCCRSYYGISESFMTKISMYQPSYWESKRDRIRTFYDIKLQTSIQAQHILYACKKGEVAHGNSETGGIFSKNLLEQTMQLTTSTKVVTIGQAFEQTKLTCPTTQKPEAILPRCMSSQELIWALNPIIFVP